MAGFDVNKSQVSDDALALFLSEQIEEVSSFWWDFEGYLMDFSLNLGTLFSKDKAYQVSIRTQHPSLLFDFGA